MDLPSLSFSPGFELIRFDLWLVSDFLTDSGSKPSFAQIVWASSIGLIIIAAMHYRIRKLRDQKIIPRLKVSDTGRVEKLESFPHYVGKDYTCVLLIIYISPNIFIFRKFQKRIVVTLL